MAESPTDVRGRIFISYRREDAAYPAGWLFDRLAERFGYEQIFKDVDSIELGDDFVEVIGEAVGSTDVLLALIGDRWLTVADEQGRRRLDDPDDFVRLEIEAALTRKVRVIPILVEGARMPREDQLPPSLKPLSRRQALELSPARFTSDTERLLSSLEKALAEEQTAQAQAATAVAATERVQEPETQSETLPKTHERERRRRAPPSPPKPPETPGWRQRLFERRRLLAAVVGAAVLLALLIGGVVLFSGSNDPEARDEGSPEAGPEAGQETDPGTVPETGPADAVNGSIAFVSDRTGENEIWSLPPGQSHPNQLTFDFAEASRPDWSPDGTQIVFASDRGNEDGDLDLWILDTADGREIHLTRGPGLDDLPDWSPDGSEVAFGRADPSDNLDDIWIVEVESRKLRQVTDHTADDDAPDWSTTHRIAFESKRDGNDFEIYTLNPAGLERDVRPVTSNTRGDFSPSWSPDGRRIAYFSLSNGGPESEIYTIRSDGIGQPRPVTSNGAINRRPSWSPDGELIAFDSDRGGQIEVFQVPWDGGRPPRELISGPGSNVAPSWGAKPQ